MGCWHLWPLGMHFVTSARTEHQQEVLMSAKSMNWSNSSNVPQRGTCAHTGCWENTMNALTLLFLLTLINRDKASMAFHLLTDNKPDLTSASTPKTNTKHALTEGKVVLSPKYCWILWSHLRSLPGSAQTQRERVGSAQSPSRRQNHRNSLSKQNNFKLTFWKLGT